MGTIVKRRLRDGSVAYSAQIMIRRNKQIVHRESKTFERKPAAAAWLDRREKELAVPGAIERASVDDLTLARVIERYVEESAKELGKTKAQVLRSIKEYDLADLPCSKIDSAAIVEFAQAKLAEGVSPATVANYLSHLGPIFDIARPAWRYPLDPQVLTDAMKVAKKLGLTKKSNQRDRRPTLEELDKLMEHFGDRSDRRRTAVPMQRIISFAIFAARRQEEIATIKWSDFEKDEKRILVRNMKDPEKKAGNDVWCDLPEPAIAIIEAMPKVADEIFPYSTDAISASFTRACKFLEIDDLHFHDLRHEGVSRLFEQGMTIPHVAAVSGHKTWGSLQRYTHLRSKGDKYKDWKWMSVVTTPDERLKLTAKGRFPRRTRSERDRA